jgi:hypothetical protein
MAITGTHLVRVLRSALQSAKHFWPRVGDRMDVRRNALKLRFWGNRHEQDTDANVLDLSYERIVALASSGIHEARIDDEIGGHRNIRLVFLVPPSEWRGPQQRSLPVLWVLEALPKKRQDWTAHDLDRFMAKRQIIKQRFYFP